MLDKTSHPFIFNTLQSSPLWDLCIYYARYKWVVTLIYDDEPSHASDAGTALSEALDRLEDALSGRGSVLAGQASE